jgi:prevent-host-death family protein
MAIVIGILEFREHASRYLRRVRAGETITLTDRGQPFAEIRPVKASGGILDKLIAEGRATTPTIDFAEFLEKFPPLPG